MEILKKEESIILNNCIFSFIVFIKKRLSSKAPISRGREGGIDSKHKIFVFDKCLGMI